jgi:alanine-glyoxylate transaminase/serine-glyoxylate transaminase/serine-pyruvate transaminase
MPPYTSDEFLSPVITAALGPENVPTSWIVDYLSHHHDINFAGGLGTLKDKIFRIGHMSPTVSDADIDQVLAALKNFKKTLPGKIKNHT